MVRTTAVALTTLCACDVVRLQEPSSMTTGPSHSLRRRDGHESQATQPLIGDEVRDSRVSAAVTELPHTEQCKCAAAEHTETTTGRLFVPLY